MLALAACASIALVPGYRRGGPSRPSLRRSAAVRLALDPAGADPADAPAPERAQQEAWPEPAFSVAELQAKEQERIEAAEAAAREAAAPLTTEDGAFSAVALVTALLRVESKVAVASASWLSGSRLQRQIAPGATQGFGLPGLLSRFAGRMHRPSFDITPTPSSSPRPHPHPAPNQVLVFFVGGFLFFQAISGAGMTQFADDQSPAVQACIKRATTRNEANICLLYVPKEGES